MATIAKPQVLVFQEFSIIPSEIADPLRAHISGPNGGLHRYDDDDEKPLINVGAYDKDNEVCYPWPGRAAGSEVDESYTRIFMDDACLLYHEDTIGDFSEGRGTVTNVPDRDNWIRSSTLSYKANGTNWPRSSLFNDRDVAVGDKVYIRGVDNDNADCDEIELWTYVTGFAADEVSSEIQECREDSNNQDDTGITDTTTISQTAGVANCVGATADGSAYDGLEDGYATETYTIEVVKSGIAGCAAARLRVTSASGTDDQAEVTPEDFGTPTDIGTRGLQVTFTDTGNSSCSSLASAAEVTENQLIFGQRWVVVVTMAFERVCCEAGGAYAGADNDVYIVEVTKGGKWSDLPQVSVTTSKGLDFSGPTEVTGPDTDFAVGSNGVTMRFIDCFKSSSSSISSGYSLPATGQTGNLIGLLTGDKFYVTVLSSQNGPIRTLTLKHDIPLEIRDATDLDLRLFIEKDGLEIAENRVSTPPLVNYEQEEKQLCLKADIDAYDATWTKNGVEQPMLVWDGTVYIQYREWLFDLTNEIGTINDVADIDTIPGPLHEDNPLKWGVFKALSNSNGTAVKFTAVLDPDDLDDWVNVIERVDGKDDLYNFVPLTYTRDVWDLFQAHVESESSPESGNWKAMFINLPATLSSMIVGKTETDLQLLHPTSTDAEAVLAIVNDDPQSTGTQYTRVQVPDANSNFITYGVQPGDIMRFLFTTDAFGNQTYSEFVVDEVLSENTLLLLEGLDSEVPEPQKMEIWHVNEKQEIVDALKDQAQSYSDRRVCATWPDLVGVGGDTQSGYFLNCALAGLASGVVPHQGLTNVEVSGWDDFSRSYKFFSGSQLDSLQDGGVWIVTEDRDGTPHSYHALTTDTLDVNRREEMIRRNVDSMSYTFLRRLRPFIGRTNVTPSMIRKLAFEVNIIIDFFKNNGFTEELGSQLIDGAIRDGFPRVHPLLADRIEIVVDLVIPAPLNNIELHLVV